MIHDLDLILALVDAELESVDAVGVPVLTAGEDIANARLRFADGTVANLTASRVSRERVRKIRIFGERRYLSVDLMERKVEEVLLEDGRRRAGPAPDRPDGVRRRGRRRVSRIRRTTPRGSRTPPELLAFFQARRLRLRARSAAVSRGQPARGRAPRFRRRRARRRARGGQRRRRAAGVAARARGARPGARVAAPDGARAVSVMRRIFLVAGEASGDLQAALLVQALRARRDDLEFWGVGWRAWRRPGCGSSPGARSWPSWASWRCWAGFRGSWARWSGAGALGELRPDLFIPVDFPDFNFRLLPRAVPPRYPDRLLHQPADLGLAARAGARAAALSSAGCWRSSPSRQTSTGAHGVPVTWVGHPLARSARPGAARRRRSGPPRACRSIGTGRGAAARESALGDRADRPAAARDARSSRRSRARRRRRDARGDLDRRDAPRV